MAPRRLSSGGQYMLIVLSLALVAVFAAPLVSLRHPNNLSEWNEHRHLQVTGALDWPSSNPPAHDSDDVPTRDQRTQEDTASAGTPPEVSTMTQSGSNTPTDETRLGVNANDVDMSRQNSHVTLGTILLVILALSMVVFVVLVFKRRQELARWREYRTHQILRAQDEAFDTNYDEAFDLELVEGSMYIS